MYEMLLVDDEKNTRNMLASCFPWDSLDFHICGQADNGKEALDFLKDHVVHVVFSDIQMPVMDGITLAKEIYQLQEPRPVVVFLSAYDEFRYAQKAIMYNVRYYALKPSSFAELTKVFSAIHDELEQRFGPGAGSSASSLPPQCSADETIQKVMEYCRNHYSHASLAELSRELYMNPSYLSQLIRQKTGRTFSEYLLEIRMQQAALFLQDPNVKIYNVSSMVGYTNPNNFSRVFHSYYHMSPSEYRAARLKEAAHENP